MSIKLNKSNHPLLFDDRHPQSYLTAPCHRLMGAVLEEAVREYKKMYRRKLRGVYNTNANEYAVEATLMELRTFFNMWCEDTSYSAGFLIRQMEQSVETELKKDKEKKNGKHHSESCTG